MPLLALSAQPRRASSESGVYPVAEAPRAKPLTWRAKDRPKLSPPREWARDIGREFITAALKGLTNTAICTALGNGGDKFAAAAREYNVPITADELALLFDPDRGCLALVKILRKAIHYHAHRTRRLPNGELVHVLPALQRARLRACAPFLDDLESQLRPLDSTHSA